MKTTLPVQKEIIAYFSGALAKAGIKGSREKARSGGGDHLRIKEYNGDIEKALNAVIPCKVVSTDFSASGSYTTEEIVLKKEIPGIAKNGDSCYLVVAKKAAGKGSLITKQLSPNTLGLAGKTIPKAQYIKMVEGVVKAAKTIDDKMKKVLYAVLESSTKQQLSLGANDFAVDESDRKTIEKDFGEMSGAAWYMFVHDKKTTAIEFPAKINEPLVDYYAHQGKKKIGISAKGGAGAAPSIEVIARILEKKKFSNPKQTAAAKAIIAIADESIIEGTLAAAKAINTPGYAWLKKNFFKKDFTASDIETKLKTYPTAASLYAALDGFYKANGRGAGGDPKSQAVGKRIFDTKARRIGFIMGPMGYGVIDELNEKKEYVDLLNNATGDINAVQIYMNIKKQGKDFKIQYDLHGFKTAKFKFHYQNSVGNLANKISFKMDISKA